MGPASGEVSFADVQGRHPLSFPLAFTQYERLVGTPLDPRLWIEELCVRIEAGRQPDMAARAIPMDWTRSTSDQAPTPRQTQSFAMRRSHARSSGTDGLGRVVQVVFILVIFVLIPWGVYANQDSQKVRCISYEISGVRRPLVWSVTCALNGHD
jgi:hypothetical protein